MITQPDKNISGDSKKWKNVVSVFLPNTCKPCEEKHGTIFPFNAIFNGWHPRCQCYLARMRTKKVGTATQDGLSGVDAFVMYTGQLPANYVTKDEAKMLGWKSQKGNLDKVLPQKCIGGDIFYNGEGKLPQKYDRIWYEADIDYISGYRNDSRILYSNDGLIFVTYDHYKTFYEITN